MPVTAATDTRQLEATRVGDAGIHALGDEVVALDAGFEDAPNLVYLVGAGGPSCTLVDAGIASTPGDRILPALAHMGVAVTDVVRLVNTHGHHDHRGGNGAMKDANPSLEIACHRVEQGWVEDVETYVRELYLDVPGPWTPSATFLERVRRLSGADLPVDRLLDDGETLGEGRARLDVHHVPAHSPGHVVLFHPTSRTLFTGDALQGEGTPLQRRAPFFPLYDSVTRYRTSLDRFEALAPEVVATSHLGVRRGSEAAELVAVARRMVDAVEGEVRDAVRRQEVTTVAEAVSAVHTRWPHYDLGAQIFRTVHAHLRQLVDDGVAVERDGERYAAVP